MRIHNYLLEIIKSKGAAYLILIDPDKISASGLKDLSEAATEAGVDGFLIGGSLMLSDHLAEYIEILRTASNLPVILFPGSIAQVIPQADALLYISLISGRNADQIIGKHVIAAPVIKKYGIEPISTGYMLVESGARTTAEYISGSMPIPRNKPEIAAATALAAQYMGMKMIYLEAGSGAQSSVPDEMVQLVSKSCDIPVIVGGGIRDPKTARNKVLAGASVIVTGNFFENDKNWALIKDFADAVHIKNPIIT